MSIISIALRAHHMTPEDRAIFDLVAERIALGYPFPWQQTREEQWQVNQTWHAIIADALT